MRKLIIALLITTFLGAVSLAAVEAYDPDECGFNQCDDGGVQPPDNPPPDPPDDENPPKQEDDGDQDDPSEGGNGGQVPPSTTPTPPTPGIRTGPPLPIATVYPNPSQRPIATPTVTIPSVVIDIPLPPISTPEPPIDTPIQEEVPCCHLSPPQLPEAPITTVISLPEPAQTQPSTVFLSPLPQVLPKAGENVEQMWAFAFGIFLFIYGLVRIRLGR